MPRPPRGPTAGLIFHVLNRAAKRATMFEDAADYEAFVALLRDSTRRFPVAIYAYCIMPNHWHLVVSMRNDGGLSKYMHWLTTTHARRWQSWRGLTGQGAVYQSRFRAIAVEQDRHFAWVCRYIERNALRASLVTRAENWPWSSLGARVKNCNVDWLARWPIYQPDDWVDYVNLAQTPAELEAFRACLRKNRPYGAPAWCSDLAHRSGIPQAARPRGRQRRQTVLFK